MIETLRRVREWFGRLWCDHELAELTEIRRRAAEVVHADQACGLVYHINRGNRAAHWTKPKENGPCR